VRLNVTKLLLDAARLEDEESRRNPAHAADADPPAPEGEALSVDERLEKHALGALLRMLKDGAVGLPLLDATAYELLGMCWDENTDAQTLKERIDFDLGLSAHLLRVANSSTHAPVVPVTRNGRAVYPGATTISSPLYIGIGLNPRAAGGEVIRLPREGDDGSAQPIGAAAANRPATAAWSPPRITCRREKRRSMTAVKEAWAVHVVGGSSPASIGWFTTSACDSFIRGVLAAASTSRPLP
jgi:hypothetical protein